MKFKMMPLIAFGIGVASLGIGSCSLLSLNYPCDRGLPDYPTGEEAELVDRSLITGIPCEPPCWNNIIPGQTTHEEVLDILQQLPFVAHESVEVNHVIHWQSALSPEATGTIQMAGGYVETITIRQLEYSLTIQELIDVMGEPEGSWVAEVERGGYCYEIEMIWPKDGLEVWLEFVTNDQVSKRDMVVTPDMHVMDVQYMVPFDSVLEQYPQYLKLFQPWEGLDAISLPR